MKTLNAIIDFIFGRKYYVIIITREGMDGFMTQSDIISSKEELEQRILAIKSGRTFRYQWTESFRSHRDYSWRSEQVKL